MYDAQSNPLSGTDQAFMQEITKTLEKQARWNAIKGIAIAFVIVGGLIALYLFQNKKKMGGV